MLATGEHKTFEGVQVKYQKKASADSSTPRPGKIIVTPGKIEVRSIGEKFPPIYVKITDLSNKPKRPMSKTSSWISLDFKQTIEAKYNYVNIQVDASVADSFLEILHSAWLVPASEKDMFGDNADEVPMSAAPVHKTAPNAVVKASQSMLGSGSIPTRSERRGGIKVDEEGSAAHPAFNNDFGQPVTQKPPQKAFQLKAMFADHGIPDGGGETISSPPKSSHELSNKPRPAIKAKGTTTEKSSYASQANKSTKNYEPVDKGLPERSFYGPSKPSQIAPSPQRRPQLLVRKNGTLDSQSRVVVTPGTNAASKVKDDTEENDNENVRPAQQQKSLTSASAVSAFDNTTRKQSILGTYGASPSSSSTQVSRFSKQNPQFINPMKTTGSCKSGSDSYKIYKAWAYKQQENIGNSCYMNATMQILAGCPIFVKSLHSAVASLQKRSATIKTFDHLMSWLSGEEKGSGQGPVKEEHLQEMRTIIKGLDSIFEEQDGRAQQDAEECLTALLGAISDECTGLGFRKRDSGASRRSLGLNNSPFKTPIKRMQSSQSDSPLDNALAEGNEQKRKMPASCDPVDLMEVKMRDVKTCASCGDTNQKEAVEHRVHLGISKEEKDEDTPWAVQCVQQLLAAEVAQEEVIGDFKCEKCLKTTDAIGTKQFVYFGEYIVIVLKRFGYDENAHLRKLNTPIRVPLYLEMADLIQGKTRNSSQRHRLNETITLEGSEKKTKCKAINLVHKTKEWIMNEEATDEVTEVTEVTQLDESPVKNLARRLSDSADLLDDEDTEQKKDKVQEEKEMDEDRTQTSTPVKESENITEPSADRRLLSRSSSLVQYPPPLQMTPTKKTTTRGARRAPTPANVVPRRKSNEETTPSRKRGRQRANTARAAGTEWLSASNRSTVCHSEPSRKEKKSRTESTKQSKFSPIVSDDEKEVTIIGEVPPEVTIDDSDDDKIDAMEEKRRKSLDSAKITPVWKRNTVSDMSKKDENKVDEYAFHDDEGTKIETKLTGKERNKRARGSEIGGPPGKKAPLTDQNALKQETPTKKAVRMNEKSENVSPLPKSSMEQTGGGGGMKKTKRKMIEASDDEVEEVRLSSGDEQEEVMEVDAIEDVKEVDAIEDVQGQYEEDRRVSHVYERSKARRERRTRDLTNKENKMEEDCEVDMNVEEEEKQDKEEEWDNDNLLGETGDRKEVEEEEEEDKKNMTENVEETEDKEASQDEFGSTEGGFVKDEHESSSADEVVGESPPEEEEEQKTEEAEEERVDTGREEEDVDQVTLTEDGEAEKKEEEKLKTATEQTALEASFLPNEPTCFESSVRSKRRTSLVSSGLADADEEKMEEGELEEQNDDRKENEKECEDVTKEKKDDDDEKKEGEERKKETEDKKEVLKKEERDEVPTKEEKFRGKEVKQDEQRKKWRALFVDTDPAPPPGHILFRPVDNRWMRSQCRLLDMTYRHEDSTSSPDYGMLRAQSSLCKVTTAPHTNDVVAIEGDGNCLFRSIAWWVTGSEEDHSAMRKKIVKFMFEFPVEFGQRITGSQEQLYTEDDNNRMLEDGEWGTQCEIYGAATLLGVDIYTYHESRWKAYRPLFEWTSAGRYSRTRMTDPSERTRYGIYLENDLNLHYDVVAYMEPVAPASDTCYRLLSSILHHGKTACSGHYVADVYDQTKQQWLHCDDDKITKRTGIEVLENAMNKGYVLVYGRNKSMKTSKEESIF